MLRRMSPQLADFVAKVGGENGEGLCKGLVRPPLSLAPAGAAAPDGRQPEGS
jgi:hypothetical protein